MSVAKTIVRDNESLDDALKRFKRNVATSGTLAESRKREFYERPGIKKRKKREAAQRKKFK